MATLNRLYKAAPLAAHERIKPDGKKIKEIEPELIEAAYPLVAELTEAHLRCQHRSCRSAGMCMSHKHGNNDRRCEAPVTRQQKDMLFAIIAFWSRFWFAVHHYQELEQQEAAARAEAKSGVR